MIKKRASSQLRIKAQFEGFVRTPPLWLGTFFDIEQFPITMELPSVYDGTSLPEPTHGPLGKRMEEFFLFYLKHYSRYRVLAHNLQIQEYSTTLGEIDFLLQETAGETLLHVELVYKVYLYDPDMEGQVNKWIGPDRGDSLKEKINRLKAHQFPVLRTSAATSLIESLGVSSNPMQQFACFKAQLYLPRNWAKAIPLLNPSCITGVWIRYEDFTQEQYGEFLFFSPTKPDWPVNAKVKIDWLPFDVIQVQVEEFIEQQRSPLLWVRQGPDLYQRMFVVWW